MASEGGVRSFLRSDAQEAFVPSFVVGCFAHRSLPRQLVDGGRGVRQGGSSRLGLSTALINDKNPSFVPPRGRREAQEKKETKYGESSEWFHGKEFLELRFRLSLHTQPDLEPGLAGIKG